MTNLGTAAILKRLKDEGFSNADIVQMVKVDGWSAVKRLAQ